MTKIEPTYDMHGDEDLSKFLLGAIRDVRKHELEVERAEVISQLADKYTKNEIMRCIKKKLEKQLDSFNVEGEINKAIMNKVEAS